MAAAEPVVQPYNGGRSAFEQPLPNGRSPLDQFVDNSTTIEAFQRQNAMRDAVRNSAAEGAAPLAQPQPQPQPYVSPSATREPYVSPFGTPPMTDEQYRALPKPGVPGAPRSALDFSVLAQTAPALLGTGGAANAGDALRRGGVRSRMDAAEGAAMGDTPEPVLAPEPAAAPAPSLFDRLFSPKPKPKVQPLRLS